MEKRSCIKDGNYRYLLTMRWAACPPGKKLVAIMCNPSTADENNDDTTTRILRKWGSQHGYGEVHIVNLFSYRTTQQRALLRLTNEEAIGEKSDRIITEVLLEADTIIAAWGDPPRGLEEKFNSRADRIASLIAGTPIYSVGKLTRKGNPRHPRRWYLEKSDTNICAFNLPDSLFLS